MDSQELTIDPNWCVVEDTFDINTSQHYESIFALGTGYMTTRSSIEEGFRDDDQSVDYDRFMVNTTLETIPTQKSRWGTFMPVIGAVHPYLRIGVVNLPYYLGLVLEADGERLDLEQSIITDYRRWLNMKTATLYRTLTWQTRSGQRIQVLFKRFMDPGQKFVCVQECQLKMIAGSADIQAIGFVDNNVRTNGFDKFVETRVGHNDAGIIYSEVVTNLDSRIVTASQMVNTKTVAIEITSQTRRINSTSSFRLDEGEDVVIKKVSAVIADAYFSRDELLKTAFDLVSQNIAQETSSLYRNHVEKWARSWGVADVEIEADDDEGYDSQLATRKAIYHLLRAKAEDEDRGLVCPKGMASEVYYGGAFWDMEIFINPFYLYTNPVTGKNTPMFRYRNLPKARELARHYGYAGARYPWVSSFNGEEVVVLWEYADHQIHITSDVVIGLWHYYLTSGDEDFLFDCGAEIIVETARYWTTRVDRVAGRPGFQLYGVMGPDEYKPLTNNNAYTNYGARFNLQLAGRVLAMMEEKAPDKYAKLVEKISLEDEEIERFQEVADGISIAVDEERNIVWQCDNFETAFVTVDVDAIWKDKTQLFGKYMLQEQRYRSKTAKQCDVVALFAVFPGAFTREQKAASFDYYEPFTIHDSSNSMCHRMIVSADLGRPEMAYESWKKSMDIDFGRLPRSSDGPHFANVGGMWQEVVFGFSGLKSALAAEVMTFTPCLPTQIKKISYKIHWKLNWVRMTVTQKELSLENLSETDLPFTVNGQVYRVEAGRRKSVRY